MGIVPTNQAALIAEAKFLEEELRLQKMERTYVDQSQRLRVKYENRWSLSKTNSIGHI